MKYAIRLDKLTKQYSGSGVAAVDALSIDIKPGEVYGFLGSNGAGKSTTIRTMLDFLRPTSGSATILGKDSVADSRDIKRSVGYLAGDVALPRRVTSRDLLGYLTNLSGGVDKDYLSELTTHFEANLDAQTQTLSKGNRQKIGLIQALMNKPDVLILDEPTSGLDPVMQERFYKAIEAAKARGAAVFLSSHSFAEVERVCDRVGIIRKGKLVHEGPVAAMMREHVPTWQVSLAKAADAAALKKSKALIVSNVNGASLTVRPAKDISSALAALSKVKLVAMRAEQDDLESEFMSFYDEGVA